MTEKVSIQWEVRYVTGSIEAEPYHIENCESEDEAMDVLAETAANILANRERINQ